MRNIRIGRVEISIECLRDTEFEKWLYLPLDILLSKKGVLDKKIVNNSAGAIKDLLKEPVRKMDITITPYEDLGWMYSESIEAVMIMAIVMEYKKNALQKCKYMLTGDQRDRIEKQLLDAIHRNAELSYWKLLSLAETEEQGSMLECMIQKRVISAVMSDDSDGRMDRKFVRWCIKNET